MKYSVATMSERGGPGAEGHGEHADAVREVVLPLRRVGRDEALRRCGALKRELCRCEAERRDGGGGGERRLGEKLTALEVRYEELREKYEEDLGSLIASRLHAEEARSRVAELEAYIEKQLMRAGAGHALD